MSRPDHPSGLSAKHLKGFDREVAKALLWLVNDQGVKYRMTDGVHILLYPKNKTERPFKVSAHRNAEGSLNYIRDFMQSNDIEEQP